MAEGKSSPGKDSLIYKPSEVAWATAEYIRRPPAFFARVFVYFLMIFLIGALIYTYFAKTAVYVKGGGKLTTAQPPFPVKADVSFKVSKLLVKENQRVRRGEMLIVSDDQLSEKDIRTIRENQQALLRILRQDSEACNTCLSELRRLQDSVFRLENKGSLRELATQLQGLVKEYVVVRGQKESSGAIDSPALNRITSAQRKLDEIRRRKAEKLLAVQVEQLESEIRGARSELSSRRTSSKTVVQQQKNALELRLGELTNQVDNYRRQHTILSPLDGIVAALQVSGPGQLIASGQDVMQLIPSNTLLLAEVQVGNRDIAKLKVGQEVKIKLEALPEREYGTVSGRVTDIPTTTIISQDANAQGAYLIKSELDQQSVFKDGTEYPFKLGMQFEALVVVKRESMLKMAVKKILNITDSLGGGG